MLKQKLRFPLHVKSSQASCWIRLRRPTTWLHGNDQFVMYHTAKEEARVNRPPEPKSPPPTSTDAWTKGRAEVQVPKEIVSP